MLIDNFSVNSNLIMPENVTVEIYLAARHDSLVGFTVDDPIPKTYSCLLRYSYMIHFFPHI